MDLAVPADHRLKLKEREKKNKYLDLARELKKLWDMKVTVIPIVIRAFGTVTKRLIQGLEDLDITGRMESIESTAFLRSTRILGRVLETWGDLISLKLPWKNISVSWREKLSRSKNNNNFTVQQNGTLINQDPSKRMKHGIFRCKQIS